MIKNTPYNKSLTQEVNNPASPKISLMYLSLYTTQPLTLCTQPPFPLSSTNDKKLQMQMSRIAVSGSGEVNLDHLGHFLVGQVGLIRKLNYLGVTRISHVL